MEPTGITTNKPKPAPGPVTAIKAPTAGQLPTGKPLGDQPRPASRKQVNPLWRALQIAASLRITVTLFVLAIFLVFFGTWAQVDQGIWTAVSKYFRSAIVWIPLHVLLLRTVEATPGEIAIPYPGGWLLGGLLLANLLAAHIVRFKVSWKRSGILMIHAGLIIMMMGELVAGLFQVEGTMHIQEGQTVNFVQHDRMPELAIIDSSDEKFDDVVAVPAEQLKTGYVSHPDLPFDIELDEYMVNSKLESAPKEGNRADREYGRFVMAKALPEVSGTNTSQGADYASAYITLFDKKGHKKLGTYLISYAFFDMPAFQEPQTVEVDGKDYQIQLRPKRTYREYQFKLLKFRFDKYPGTETPKNYQSDIVLFDKERNENRKETISMNRPLRYRGETFYQASFTRDGFGAPSGTVLQVVNNWGWWMPYLACIVVTAGMLIHFGINLLSFLQKRMAS